MNVLHLSAVKIWGGGENHIVNLCQELALLSPEVNNLIFCKENSQFLNLLGSTKLKVVSAPLAFKLDPRYMYELAKTCKQQKIDLIHIHDSTALALAVTTDQFVHLPPFILSKKTSFPIRPRKQTLYKYNYHKIRKILCVSEATRVVTSQAIEKHDRLKVIYHGTRLDNKAQNSPFWIRKKYKIPANAKLIGNIGNHIEAKHLETFIRTAHYLVNLKQQKDFYFVQIGSFSRRTPALKTMVEEFGLKEHVIFTGYIPEASAFIPQFDVMLLTSENEGIPQVIYESFYYNVPVISTKVGGIPEVIENRVNGLLCDPYDHVGLGENLLFLIANPQVIPTFAKISREKLLQNFTSQIMAQKTLAEYKKAINGRLHRRIE